MIWPLVVGLGSHHGDDQAGWLVLERLRDRHYPPERLIRLRHPADLLDVIDPEQVVVICDACRGIGQPGSTRRFQWPTDKIDYHRSSGSHDLSLCAVMDLGRVLGCFPRTIQIWALEGNEWTAGTVPSVEVESAANQVAEAILQGCVLDTESCLNER